MSNLDTECKYLLRVHENIITVPEVINELYMEYEELGYKMKIKLSNSFSYALKDGTVILVYWEKGKVFEKVVVGDNVANIEGIYEEGILKQNQLKIKLLDILELDDEDRKIVVKFLREQSIEKMFTHYEMLDLTSNANEKLETLKLLIG